MKKKNKILRREHRRLLSIIEIQKQKRNMQKEFISKGIDPSIEVLARMKMEEAKYLFLLKVARTQK